MQNSFALHSSLLQDTPRGDIFQIRRGIYPINRGLLKCPLNQGACCLGYISFAPVCTGSYVSNPQFYAFDARVNHPDDLTSFFHYDHIREAPLTFPGSQAASNKLLCLLDALMWAPGEIARDFPVLRPACKNERSILHMWFSQDQSSRLNLFGHSHVMIIHPAKRNITNERTGCPLTPWAQSYSTT